MKENTSQVVGTSRLSLRVAWADPRTYSKQPDLKCHIESPILTYCESNGIKAREAWISGPAHEGGTNGGEPRHVTAKLIRRNGSIIMAKHPLTNKWTKSHHVYV